MSYENKVFVRGDDAYAMVDLQRAFSEAAPYLCNLWKIEELVRSLEGKEGVEEALLRAIEEADDPTLRTDLRILHHFLVKSR